MAGQLLWILAVSLGVTRVTGANYLFTDIHLNTNYPPHVTDPIRQTTMYITENFPASVYCAAKGNPNPQLEWRFNGNRIAPDNNIQEFHANGSLFITNFSPDLEGYYQCLAINNYGISLSQIVEMRLRVFPSFTNEAKPNNIQKVAEGAGIKLECTDKPYSRPPGPFHWYHVSTENEQIHVRSKDHMDIDQEGNLYIIEAKKEDASATYACAMSSDNLAKVSIAKTPYVDLQVTDREDQQFKPIILGSTVNATAKIGGEVTLECFFSGQPRPSIAWVDGRRNRPVVNGSENNRLTISTSGHKLVIKRVRDDDQGKYKCEASNIMGKESTTVNLNVTSRPLFKTTSPQLIVAPVGDDATFTCEAEGATGDLPVSRPRWSLNGDSVIQNGTNKYHFSDDGRKMTFVDITKTDMTCLQCNVSNSEGYAFGDGYLIVIDPLRIVGRPNRTIEIEPKSQKGGKGDGQEGGEGDGQEGDGQEGDEQEGGQGGEVGEKEVNITIEATSDLCCPVRFVWFLNGKDLRKSKLHSPPLSYDHHASRSPERGGLLENRATLSVRLSGDREADQRWLGEYRCDVWHSAYDANATVKVTLKMKVEEEPKPLPVKAGFNLWWVALLAGILVLIIAGIIVFLMVHFNYPRQAYLLEKEERKHHLDRDKDILDHSFEEI